MMKVVERTFGYFEASPVMILRPAGRDNRNRFIIKLNDIWKYSEDHNELFESFMINRVIQLCGMFGITVPKGEVAFAQLMSSIATVIMEGIDDLVKMAPYQEGHDDPGSMIDMPQQAGDMPDIHVRMLN